MQIFLDSLRKANSEDWQVSQAERAIRLYFHNFQSNTDWKNPLPSPSSNPPEGPVSRESALTKLRECLRLRHYSYRTEQTYADWVNRFFGYLEQTGNSNEISPESARHLRKRGDLSRDTITLAIPSAQHALSGLCNILRHAETAGFERDRYRRSLFGGGEKDVYVGIGVSGGNKADFKL